VVFKVELIIPELAQIPTRIPIERRAEGVLSTGGSRQKMDKAVDRQARYAMGAQHPPKAGDEDRARGVVPIPGCQ